MAGLDLSSSFGVVYWGFVIATVLFGVTIVQGYFFFLGSKDSWKLKSFVALLMILDIATTALSSELLHYHLIINFGNQLTLLAMAKPFISEYVITLFITFVSQLFYAWRIYVVKTRHWVPFLIMVLAIISFGAGLALAYELFAVDRLIANFTDRRIRTCMGLSTSFATVCDFVSTAAMCYFLASPRSDYKETRTNTALKAFLFFIVNRGILAAVSQAGHFAMFLAYPSKTYWMPFHLSLSKLHLNTLLAMLNSRSTLRAKADAAKLEVNTNFTSVNSNSPRTPCKRYSGRVNARELVDFPNDWKRPDLGSPRVHPYDLEEGISEVDVSAHGKPMVLSGEVEPITFA